MIKSLPPAVKHKYNNAATAAALLHGPICDLPNMTDLSPSVLLPLWGPMLWILEFIQVDVGPLMVSGNGYLIFLQAV